MNEHPLYKLGINFILAGLVTTIINLIAYEISPLEGALLYTIPSLTFVTIYFLRMSGENNHTIAKYLWSVVVTMPIFIATCAIIAWGLSTGKNMSYSISIAGAAWVLMYVFTKIAIQKLGYIKYFT